MDNGIKVNVHGHVVPVSTLGKAGKYGPWVTSDPDGRIRVRVGEQEMSSRPVAVREEMDRTGQVSPDSDPFRRMSDPELRLKEMAASGTDIMLLTGIPHFFFYWADSGMAAEFAELHNDAMADYCSADPTRLMFLANVPLQDPERAATEAERAITKCGAKGLNIGVLETPGFELDREELFPLYDVASRHGAPIWLHPAPLTLAPDVPRKRYFADQIIVFPYLITKALFEFMMGGVFDTFPNLSVCAAHGGGFLPYQIGRLTTMAKVAEEKRGLAPVEDYLKNVYCDNLVHDLRPRRLLVEVLGADQVVVGDNYSGMDSADGFAMLDELGLSPDDTAKIAGENAARIFNLAPPAARG